MEEEKKMRMTPIFLIYTLDFMVVLERATFTASLSHSIQHFLIKPNMILDWK